MPAFLVKEVPSWWLKLFGYRDGIAFYVYDTVAEDWYRGTSNKVDDSFKQYLDRYLRVQLEIRRGKSERPNVISIATARRGRTIKS